MFFFQIVSFSSFYSICSFIALSNPGLWFPFVFDFVCISIKLCFCILSRFLPCISFCGNVNGNIYTCIYRSYMYLAIYHRRFPLSCSRYISIHKQSSPFPLWSSNVSAVLWSEMFTPISAAISFITLIRPWVELQCIFFLETVTDVFRNTHSFQKSVLDR